MSLAVLHANVYLYRLLKVVAKGRTELWKTNTEINTINTVKQQLCV